MRGRVTGIEADRALKLAFGAGPIPILRRLHVRQRGMCLGGIGIEHDRRRRARGCLGPHFRRAEHAVMGEQPVGVRQSCVSQRVLGIFDQRLFEKIERLAQAFLGSLVQVIAPLEVQVVRREILGGTTNSRSVPLVDELRFEFLEDRRRHTLPAPQIHRRPASRSTRTTDSNRSHHRRAAPSDGDGRPIDARCR